MNSTIITELYLVLNKIDNISENNAVKVMNLCSKIMDNIQYNTIVKNTLDTYFKMENFNMADFPRLMLAIIKLNEKLEYVDKITVDELKYIIYAVLINYLFNNQINFINTVSMDKIRITYFNCVELMIVMPNTIKISKEGCCSCIGRAVGSDWLVGEKILI